MDTLQAPLVTVGTKLRPPKQRRNLLRRDRLMRDEIEPNLNRRLLLVSAPAGYGKTSILAQCFDLLSTQRRHVAWISVDPEDNDIVRFVAHVTEAIRRSGVSIDQDPKSILHAGIIPGLIPSPAALKAEMLNELARLRGDLFLFLDDFHLIEERGISDLVGALLLAPLEKLHVVVAARGQPKLPVARLRALGDIHEIEAQALAFSSEETSAFVQSAGGVTLSPSQTEQLRKRTEGWAASLQMAAIAMRCADDVEAFLRQFTGADRSVADFLIEEVLKYQSDDIQRFLLATSILDRFNADLANAVLECPDSRLFIDRIESLNLFIFSLDRERNWYRYHHLFSDLLRRRLNDRQPDLAVGYHRRACDWLAAHDLPTDAIEHAFAIKDVVRAGALIDAASTGLFASGQTTTLQAHADRLPAALLKTLPRLQLEMAWENMIRWRFDDAREALNDVRVHVTKRAADAQEMPRKPEPDAEKESLSVILAHRDIMLAALSDDLERAVSLGFAWATGSATDDPFMNASVEVAMIMCRRETFSCDRVLAEAEAIRQQLVEGRAIYGTVFLDTVVGNTFFMRGELGPAAQSLAQARNVAIHIHGEQSTLAAMPSAQLAQVLYEENRLTEARRLIDECRELSLEFGLVDSVIARQLTSARLAYADGDPGTAHRALDIATGIADRYAMQRLHAHVFAERVRLLIAEGLSRDAERLKDDARYRGALQSIAPTGDVNTTRECFAIAAARLACERGEVGQAIASMRRWLNWTRDRHCLRSSIRLAILLAHFYVRNGESLAARRSLIEALHWGADGGFIRSFTDEGTAISALLEELARTPSESDVYSRDYVKLLLRSFGGRAENDLVLPLPVPDRLEESASLSEREIEIIRLTANSLATQEIADALGLAESTVKWYWRRIFEKLGVHRRAVAVRLARQRGLI
ncbi:Serine/threonine-protein kinase PknK [Pandoraea terrae]|uniref:Serine/threonine-protein kinase PknK n=1 Tax=Pandoraea terrae TaxID=1537710 RepID=A0A5E4UAH6_9BURK|nr:LuxR C-terminal-related transcriptional regulator [Pandoraea terrae]VVD96502.1 Serine/threonine-protein kinase PknK [Pandoraea terrae]